MKKLDIRHTLGAMVLGAVAICFLDNWPPVEMATATAPPQDVEVSSAVDTALRSADVEELATNATLVFSEDFTGASYDSAIKSFNGGSLSHNTTDDRLEVTFGSGAAGIYLDAADTGFTAGDWYAVEVDWEDAGGDCDSITWLGAWSDQELPRGSWVDPTGHGVAIHQQTESGSTGSFYNFTLTGEREDGDFTSRQFYINEIRIWKVPSFLGAMFGNEQNFVRGTDIVIDNSDLDDAIIIGNGITSGGAQGDVMIGHAVVGAQNISSESNVVIGENANIDYDGTYGGNANQFRTAVGANSVASSWRATAFGAYAEAQDTSSSAFGFGSSVEVTHGDAFGRGSYIPDETGAANLTVIANADFYLRNGTHHISDLPNNGIANAETDGSGTPQLNPCTIHGKDAFDARATPSDTSTQGGDMNVAAGVGTGTATGGVVNIQTSLAGGVDNNTKNALVDVARFDYSTTAGETRFLLYDVDNGTLERVTVGAADSGGSGYKVLRIPN